MNMKLLLLLSSTLYMATFGATVKSSEIGDCHLFSVIPAKCSGKKEDPKVVFNTVVIRANPPNVCAAPGTTLTIQIVPAADRQHGSVGVIPKDSAHSWLAGTNSVDPGKIEISIPEWVSSEADYDYGFVTSDGKCLDPRVHVVD